MIQLSNIQLEANQKIFSKQSRKLIRFSYKNSIITSQKQCIYINNATIKWDECLNLPEVYNQRIDFQIYNEHSFGFNPQQLQNLLYGSIKILQNKTIGKWEVFSQEQDGQKAGFITFDVKKVNKKAKQVKPTPITENKIQKTLQSILVRGVKVPSNSGYITVNTGAKNYQSPTVEAIKGEYVFNLIGKNNSSLVKSLSSSDKLIATFYSSDAEMIGESICLFKTSEKLIKSDMVDGKGKKIGEMYFEIQLGQSSGAGQVSYQTKNVQHDKPTQLKNYQEQKEIQPKATNQSKITLNKLRSMSLTKLSHISGLGDSQLLGTARRKRVSVVHHNNDIYFPSQKRFMNYQDKQTNIISYSQLPTMKFQQLHSHKYYKGASFGMGNKSDFTLYYRQNPGVGQYKLPSIFDRY